MVLAMEDGLDGGNALTISEEETHDGMFIDEGLLDVVVEEVVELNAGGKRSSGKITDQVEVDMSSIVGSQGVVENDNRKIIKVQENE